MKTKLLLVLLSMFLFSGLMAQTVYPGYIDGHLYFKFNDDYNFKIKVNENTSIDPKEIPADLSEMFDRYGVTLITRPLYAFGDKQLERILRLEFVEAENIDVFIKELELNPDIEYAEKVPLPQKFVTYNDPYYSQSFGSYGGYQWYLSMIGAEQAWALQTGSSSIKVAVVDGAVYGDHEDLGISSSNQCSFANGTASVGSSAPPTSVTYNRNCTTNQMSTSGGCPSYEWSHGTHCAGLVAAKNNNNKGISSIGGGVTLMGVRAANNNDQLLYCSNGVAWAVNQGAKVVSMSYGSSSSSTSEQTACRTYYNNGVILVAAAGNEGDGTNQINYPAGYSYVISVASVDYNGKLSDFSQYGNGRADIAAPGGYYNSDQGFSNIISTTYCTSQYVRLVYGALNGVRYDGMQGTSMATPIVAGLCGLMASAYPDITPAQAKSCLQSTATTLTSGSHAIDGNGYINAAAAVQCAKNLAGSLYVTPMVLNFTGAGGTATFTVSAGSSNSRWSSTANGNWFTYTPNSGNGSNRETTVTVTVPENPGAARTGTITITHGTETATITINQTQNASDGWYGNDEDYSSYDPTASAHQVVLCSEKFGAYNPGQKVLKVKFATYIPASGTYASYNNGSFAIKIYEGGQFTGTTSAIAAALGTEVYSQNYTASVSTGINEFVVDLTTPYTINNNNFWISVYANGNTCFLYDGIAQDSVTTAQYNAGTYPEFEASCNYLTTYTSSGTKYLFDNSGYWYNDDESYVIGGSNEYYLSFYLSNDGSYTTTSDLEADLFGGVEDGYLVDAPTSYNLSATEDLVIYPFYRNNGSDNATTGTMTLSLTLGTQTYWTDDFELSAEEPVETGGWYNLVSSPYAVTISAEDMDDMGLQGSNFDVCFSVSYTGNDPNETNNSSCIPVTREAPAQYTVNLSANPTAGGTVTGGGRFYEGTSVTATATPNAHYTFTNWTENGTVVSTDAAYTFTLTSNRTLVANFQVDTYAIAVSANPTAGGSVTGGATYDYGASVTVTATSNTCYSFTNWTENGTVVSTNATYTFTASAARTLVANFTQDSYAIVASANPAAGGTITGARTYNCGATATLRATANTGYTFTNWTENGVAVSTNANYSFSVSAARTLVANFTQNAYTITATANPVAGGTITGAGSYNYGATATLVASVNPGYTFTNWTENGTVVSTNATYSFTVNNSRTLVANYTAITYSITASASPTAGGTVTGTGTYNYNASVTVTATSSSCYTFTNWTENGTVVSTNATYTFTATENRTLVANFTQNTYVITASASPAEAGNVTGARTYSCGATATLSATANTGYTFTKWTENNVQVSTNANYSFTVSEARTLVANFSTNSYTITASANPTDGGTITGGGTYLYGQTATLTATPATGYSFTNWTENGTVVSTDESYAFTVTGNRTLVANFSTNSYTVSANVNPTAAGTITGAGAYNHGATATLTATADDCYTFTNWTENGSVVSTSATYTFTVTGNRTLVANFSINSYLISVSASPADYGSVTGAGTYTCGTSAALTATANTGYSFTNWTENGTVVSTSAAYSFTVSGARTLVANFSANSYVITVNTTGNGSATGGGSYDYGQTATLTAVPADHYHFVSWNDGNTDNPRTVTVTGNTTYTASFAIDQHVIIVNSNPTEGGIATGGGTFNYGTSIHLVATANSGYHFVSWSDDQDATATRTYTVTGDATLTANFAEDEAVTYTITASAGEGGSINPSGAIIVLEGESQSFTIVADTHYSITSVLVDGTEALASLNNGVYTFNNVRANHTIIASFTEDEIYTITTSSNPTAGGTTTGAGSYYAGETVSVNATASTHYSFRNWTEGSTIASTSASYTFVANANRNLVANFAIDTYTITVTGNNCTTTGSGTYNYGQTVVIAATANDYYHFVSWSDGSTENPRTISVTESAIYTAVFAIDQYTITVNASGNGTTTGSGVYNYGEVVQLTATANTGYHFVRWNDNVTSSTRTHVVVDDAEFIAYFEVDAAPTYTITATAGNGGSITPSGQVSVVQGAIQSFTITANQNFNLTSVLVDGVEAINSLNNGVYTFNNVTANHTISATFSEVPSYLIIANPSSTAAGTTTGSGMYREGETVIVSATANANYSFTNWTENGTVVSTSTTYSFIATAARNLVANFTIDSYTITVNGNNCTTIGSGTYDYGQTIVISATADEHYHFVSWTDGSVENPRTITVNGSATYTAVFAIDQFTVTVTAVGAGSATGTGVYDYGTVINMVATPNAGAHFVGWNDNSTVNPRSHTVVANAEFIAYFEGNTYTITASAGIGGAITPAGEVTVAEGASQAFTITVEQNYTLTSVLVDGVESMSVLNNGVYTFTNVTANHTIIASFTEIPSYMIVATPSSAIAGSTTGTGMYREGETAIVTAFVNENYVFTNWTENGAVVSTDAQYEFTVTGTRTLVANFDVEQYEIVVSGDNCTTTGSGVYDFGQTVVISATADEHYHFVSWLDGITDNPRVITVIGDADYVAVVEADQYTITVTANGAGTVTGTGTYAYGTVIEMIATPDAGSYFVNWNDGNTENPRTHTVVADAEFLANFQTESCYTVTNLAAITEEYGNVISWDEVENAVEYQVYRGTETTPIATVQTTSYIDAGATEGETYYVITICQYGESDPSEEVIAHPSVDIESAIIEINMYPNPTNGFFTIECANIETVEIFNTVGQHISTMNVAGDSIQIDASRWTPGVYNVRITTNNEGVIVKQIIRQ